MTEGTPVGLAPCLLASVIAVALLTPAMAGGNESCNAHHEGDAGAPATVGWTIVATDADCEWDVNFSGGVSTADALPIKIRFGFAAPECP